MSIELPEAKILAGQMDKELRGKPIKAYHLQDCDKLQKMGFLNKNMESFEQLVNRKVESVISRGNTILVKLSGGMNIVLFPEYGGEVFYHSSGTTCPKYHLKVDFSDNTALTVRLTGIGGIRVLTNDDIANSYVFKRDFNPQTLVPLDEEFTLENFSNLLRENNKALKSVLVGKDAIVVGLSNSAFQDIAYRAKLHPKRKVSDLGTAERRSLYDAIQLVLKERIRLNGKVQFLDFYGRQGSYTPAMGPNMKQQNCLTCRTPIQKLSVGGGQVYFCPKCQA